MTSNGVTADDRPEEKVCDVDDCSAWKSGEHDYCHHHKGLGMTDGAPEGNVNALKHGLRADPINLLENIRQSDEKAYAWIQDKFESYLEVAPFDRDSAHADQLLQICVREYSIWRASGLQIRDGVLKKGKKVAGDDVITTDIENPANQAVDRMERTVVKRLEKLGVMPSPEQQQAESVRELGDVVAEALEPQE